MEEIMRATWFSGLTLAVLITGLPVRADEPGIVAHPTMLFSKAVEGMPTGQTQGVRVLTATLQPGDRTPFHTHRFPVTVYILEGVFTLEMQGRLAKKVSAGQVMIEPPNVPMVGYNRSTTEAAKIVIFYVSDPDTPFLDLVH